MKPRHPIVGLDSRPTPAAERGEADRLFCAMCVVLVAAAALLAVSLVVLVATPAP